MDLGIEEKASSEDLLFFTALLAVLAAKSASDVEEKKASEVNDPSPPVKRTRTRVDRGNIDSSVYCTKYLNNPDVHQNPRSQAGRAFKTQFRMSFQHFLHLLEMVSQAFPATNDCTGKASTRVDVLLLGALAFLGGSQSFQSIEIDSNVSMQKHRDFLKRLCTWGKTDLYGMYVHVPQTPEEIDACLTDYALLGLPGTIGSVDATHVVLKACPENAKNEQTGKEGQPTRAFQAVVRYNRQLLHTTPSMPGRWNDKTISKKDAFLIALNSGIIAPDAQWTTNRADGEQTVWRGKVHVICDSGYPSAPKFVASQRPASRPQVLEFNRQIGRVRKDVECWFGVMKKRWRIFQTGWPSQDIEALDNAWYFCCALQNMLLKLSTGAEAIDDEDDEDRESEDGDSEIEDVHGDQNTQGGNGASSEEHSLNKRRSVLIEHFEYLQSKRSRTWIPCRSRPVVISGYQAPAPPSIFLNNEGA